MKNNRIFSDYKKKIKLLKKYNEYYFDKNKPLVDDKKYDDLKKQILNLENKYQSLKKQKSISTWWVLSHLKILINHHIKFQCYL